MIFLVGVQLPGEAWRDLHAEILRLDGRGDGEKLETTSGLPAAAFCPAGIDNGVLSRFCILYPAFFIQSSRFPSSHVPPQDEGHNRYQKARQHP